MPWPMSTSTREFIKGKKYISSAKWKTKEKYMGFRTPLFWSIFIFLKSDFGIISGVVANCLLYCVRYDDTIVWTHSENPTWRILVVNTKHIPTIQKVHIGGKTCDKLAFIYRRSIPRPKIINTPGSSPNQISGSSPNQVTVSLYLKKTSKPFFFKLFSMLGGRRPYSYIVCQMVKTNENVQHWDII